MNLCNKLVILFLLSLTATVRASDANRLGSDLTPMGAEMAGNEAGTIPAWSGGITAPPAGYVKGEHHRDPYGDDAILFTINASNMGMYAANISAGHQTMLNKYPSFKMNVYPTRRSFSAPQYIYNVTKALVGTSRLEKGGNGVLNAAVGTPFAIPENAVEVIWNHILRYRGESIFVENESTAIVRPNGDLRLSESSLEVLIRYSHPGTTVASLDNEVLLFKSTTTAGPQKGMITLVRETINQRREPRRSWIYDPGAEEVLILPTLAYDYPVPGMEGLRVVDQYDMYNGSPDRYNWTLLGKREIYVPYNSYKLHSDTLSHREILTPGHLNPDHLRYELHRVWVVQAELKPKASHKYPKRVFYVDEDSWSILLVDIYDAKGNLWRTQESHPINYYESKVFMPTVEAFFDLQSESYIAKGLDNEHLMRQFNVPMSRDDFKPRALGRQDSGN